MNWTKNTLKATLATAWKNSKAEIAKSTAFVRTMEAVKMAQLVGLKKLRSFATVHMDISENSAKTVSE